MSEPIDTIAEARKEIAGEFDEYFNEARKKSLDGELVVVKEMILEPFRGHGFEVGKGQVLRYELIDGVQALDVVYLAKKRPLHEMAANSTTGIMQSIQQYVGDHLWTNPPYFRPLLTMIKDTVDTKKLEETYGPTTSHNWACSNGRCSTHYIEKSWGVVNSNSCDMNVTQGIYEIAGEEVAANRRYEPGTFIHFAVGNFHSVPTALRVYSAKDLFKRGDHIELLCHDDIYVSVSPCPYGDFNDLQAGGVYANWPIKVQILEGKDGPLRTIPEIEFKSTEVLEFVKAGRPGMLKGPGTVGDKNSPGYLGDPEG